MQRKLPPVKSENRILIICEGFEEYDYIHKLKTCGVWSKNFSIEIENAKSIDKIYSKYSYKFKSSIYKLVFIFCDTETAPFKQFIALKKDLIALHGKNVADNILFFANPCTLQIVLSHFEKISLSSNKKSDNATLINKITNIKDYRATESQRNAMMKKISAENYTTMKENIADLSEDYAKTPSSNVLRLFNSLEIGNESWLKNLSKKIDK